MSYTCVTSSDDSISLGCLSLLIPNPCPYAGQDTCFCLANLVTHAHVYTCHAITVQVIPVLHIYQQLQILQQSSQSLEWHSLCQQGYQWIKLADTFHSYCSICSVSKPPLRT